jgi:pimeloyl-[acyl-carrier protein] methyl ester esterase
VDVSGPVRNFSVTPRHWLLLRGLGRDARHWFGFEQQLGAALGTSCHLLDLPGAGNTSASLPIPSVPWIAQHVAQRLTPLVEANAGPWGILGLSLGGMVGLSLCRQRPAWFSHLVLINSSSRLSAPWQRLRPRGLSMLLGALPAKNATARERRIYALTLNLAARHGSAWAARAAAFSNVAAPRRAAVLAQLVAAARFKPAAVAQPTLVLSARGDRMVSPRCSRDLSRFLNAEHREHALAGHDLPLDAPGWVIAQIQSWLTNH